MIPAAIPRHTQHILDLQRAFDKARNDMASMLEEAQVYIGLNDADTREQLLDTEQYVSDLKVICRDYAVPFSFDVVEGGYVHDDGEYTEEKSIVLTFIDVSQETVEAIAKDVCTLFHQESVLITTERIHVQTVRATS